MPPRQEAISDQLILIQCIASPLDNMLRCLLLNSRPETMYGSVYIEFYLPGDSE